MGYVEIDALFTLQHVYDVSWSSGRYAVCFCEMCSKVVPDFGCALCILSKTKLQAVWEAASGKNSFAANVWRGDLKQRGSVDLVYTFVIHSLLSSHWSSMQLRSQPYLARPCFFIRLHSGLTNPFLQARLHLYVFPIPQM
jgi:hypothetical protein